MSERFTEKELEIVKSVDLTEVASYLGYTVKKIGHYHTLKEMDSIRIYDRKHWFRWSRQYEKGENGGSQIDFLRVFCDMNIKEAVWWLLDFSGYRRIPDKSGFKLKHQINISDNVSKSKKFKLPEPARNNRYLYSYLSEDRAISKKVIDYFIKAGLIYESRDYHNIVFKGNDKDGVTRFASMRGVFDKNGKVFKCDVAGNDKQFGFNVVNKNSSEVIVFEGAIDLMSYIDIFNNFESNKIALGMISDAPLEMFLKEHSQINTIYFCLDNDEPGRKAAKILNEKYYGLGYEVEDRPPPVGYKDYNEWLVSAKQKLCIHNHKKIL